MGEEGNRELDSKLATLEEELKEYLKILEELKDIFKEAETNNSKLKEELIEYLSFIKNLCQTCIFLSKAFNEKNKLFFCKELLNDFFGNLNDLNKIFNTINKFIRKSATTGGSYAIGPYFFCFKVSIEINNNKINLNFINEQHDIHCLNFLHLKVLKCFNDLFYKLFSLEKQRKLLTQIQEYKNFIENKFRELQQAKQQLEEFLKEETLKKFSEKYQEESKSLSTKIFIVGGLSVITLILAGALITWIIANIPNSKQLNYAVILTKFGLAAFLGTLSFYFIKYAIKLSERQDEYRYKALVLSTFPALNAFLQDDEKRFALIQTLILENQKLQTISGSKDDKLPVEELIQLLKLLKDKK